MSTGTPATRKIAAIKVRIISSRTSSSSIISDKTTSFHQITCLIRFYERYTGFSAFYYAPKFHRLVPTWMTTSLPLLEDMYLFFAFSFLSIRSLCVMLLYFRWLSKCDLTGTLPRFNSPRLRELYALFFSIIRPVSIYLCSPLSLFKLLLIYCFI